MHAANEPAQGCIVAQKASQSEARSAKSNRLLGHLCEKKPSCEKIEALASSQGDKKRRGGGGAKSPSSLCSHTTQVEVAFGLSMQLLKSRLQALAVHRPGGFTSSDNNDNALQKQSKPLILLRN